MYISILYMFIYIWSQYWQSELAIQHVRLVRMPPCQAIKKHPAGHLRKRSKSHPPPDFLWMGTHADVPQANQRP